MATTTTQAPEAPPTLTLSTTHDSPSSASTSAATTPDSLTKQGPSLASLALTRTSLPSSDPLAPQHQRSDSVMQAPVQSFNPAPAPSRTGSQTSHASSQKQPSTPASGTPPIPSSSSPKLHLASSQQAHASHQTQNNSPVSTTARQNPAKKGWSKFERTNTVIAIILLVLAVVTIVLMVLSSESTRLHEFHEECFAYFDHHLPMKTGCPEGLQGPRVPVLKREANASEPTLPEPHEPITVTVSYVLCAMLASFAVGIWCGITYTRYNLFDPVSEMWDDMVASLPTPVRRNLDGSSVCCILSLSGVIVGVLVQLHV